MIASNSLEVNSFIKTIEDRLSRLRNFGVQFEVFFLDEENDQFLILEGQNGDKHLIVNRRHFTTGIVDERISAFENIAREWGMTISWVGEKFTAADNAILSWLDWVNEVAPGFLEFEKQKEKEERAAEEASKNQNRLNLITEHASEIRRQLGAVLV